MNERPPNPADLRLEILGELVATVAARRGTSAESSYTARLLSEGIAKCAKKVGEEAVETALAAVSGERAHLRAEAADLIYHLVVLLEAAELPICEVMDELERRIGRSGLAERAARKAI